MLIVGLTGGIGSGKTAVSNLFKKLDIDVIDTDVIARHLISNDNSVIKSIIAEFGDTIVDQDGAIDRKKLAHVIFNDNESKQQLENILHPEIRRQTSIQIEHLNTNKNPKYIIVVIPLLFETGFGDIVDRSLAVVADEAVRIARVKSRDNRALDEINAIIKSQVADDTRMIKADDIIENNNDINQLADKVKQLHTKYSSLSPF